MNFEDLAAELLAQPLDQFTAQRNARIKQVRAEGRADLAGQLSGLKKPSLPLWAVNQVAAHNRATLDELEKAGQALIKAQAAAGVRANAARDLRAASEEFQRRLEAAGNAAAAALRESGHAAGDEALRRIREILRLAVLQGGDPWRQLEAGGLTTEPRPGEDMLDVFGLSLPLSERAGAGLSLPLRGRAGAGLSLPLRGRAGEGVAERAQALRAEKLAQKAARGDAERAQRAAATARRLREEATEASAAAERAAERAKAAEAEAVRAQAQAEKSQRRT